MNIKDQVSTIMKTTLITVSESDGIDKIRELFDTYQFHHLPVVQYKTLVGLISKSDINFLLDPSRVEIENIRMAFVEVGNLKAKDIMIRRLGKLEPEDKIEVAIDIFLNNHFRCLPVVKGEELVGLVTPNDILRGLV